MSELLVRGGRKARPPRAYPYDFLFAEPQGDQVLFHAWREEGCTLSCTCQPETPIRMGLRNHPVHKERVQVLYQIDRDVDHAPTCPRYAEDSPTPVRRVVHEPAVHTQVVLKDGKAQTRVLLHMADLFAPDDPAEALRESVDDEPQLAIETHARPLRKAPTSGTATHRAKLAFGGLIREWYVLGLQNATDFLQSSPKKMALLLRGMRHVMLDEQVALDDSRPLKQIAMIPSSKLSPTRLDKKIIVGEVVSRESIGDGDESWGVQGVDATWAIRVRAKHLPRHDGLHHLAALRVTMEVGVATTTHRVFDTLVHPHGCVWLDSSYEWQVYAFLVSLHRMVEKPLQAAQEWFGFCPDFVIRGYAVPILIEVWGMAESNPVYRRHMETKRETYRSAQSAGIIQLVEWNVERDGNDGLDRLKQTIRRLTGC